MENCLFCRIIQKIIPARLVHEDETVVAFEDINPQAPVHILVIPRKHIATSLEISPEDSALLGHMVRVAAEIARARGIADRGFRLVMNTNPEAGQTVYHIHLHILGGRPMHWPPG
ncbi:MAG: histidine triad nucleotide-binding protein [Thermodesulfovibrionales bacterium]